MEKLKFDLADADGSADFFVLEQTKINGVDYLLVTDSAQGDGEAWVLKDLSADTDQQALYEIVENEKELEAVSAVFSEMLEDVELSL